MLQKNELSHRDAQTIVAAIQAKLDEGKKGAAVAVVDSHGELLAFVRTDGCRLPSINIAINKAYTAARELGEASRRDAFPLTNFGELRYVGWGGGMPIIVNDEVVGAVGVSGLPEQEDMELAKMGIAALKV
jgi:glc operon protein GlcG